MDLRGFIEDLTILLGDWPDQGGPLSNQRFPVATLQRLVHEGRALVATVYRPREHRAAVRVKLRAQRSQDLATYGRAVLRVLDVRDADERVLADPQVTANSKRDWSSVYPAPPGQQLVWQQGVKVSVTRVPEAPTLVLVDPVPARDCEWTALILMDGVAPAEWQLTDDVSAYPYLAAVRHYVLSAAYAGQLESAAAMNTSEAHFKRFERLVSVDKAAAIEVVKEAAA